MRVSQRDFFSAVVAAAASYGWTGPGVRPKCEASGATPSESPSAEQSAPLDVQTYTSDKYGFQLPVRPAVRAEGRHLVRS